MVESGDVYMNVQKLFYFLTFMYVWKLFIVRYRKDFPGGSDGKASACNAGDLGSLPGSGRSPEKEMAIQSSTLAWKIPLTEESGRLQSMG